VLLSFLSVELLPPALPLDEAMTSVSYVSVWCFTEDSSASIGRSGQIHFDGETVKSSRGRVRLASPGYFYCSCSIEHGCLSVLPCSPGSFKKTRCHFWWADA
jgi:hypothetical protein